MLKKINTFYDKSAKILGNICMLIMVLMILDVSFNVTARYFFKYGNVAMQELEWHFFAIVFLLGMSYCLQDDSHVRVDIFYSKFSSKTKALINMLGAVFFIIPFAFLVSNLSIEYVIEAYNSAEASPDPGGLSNRWIIKALIPFSFYLLIFFTFGFFVKNLNIFLESKGNKV